MNLTIDKILADIPKCEEWTEKRTIAFMNTLPNQGEGIKSARDFIDSVGKKNITYEEIFWVLIHYINDRNKLFKYLIDTIEYIEQHNKNNGIKNKIDSLKNYELVKKTKAYLRNSKENMKDNIKAKIEAKKDIDTEIRILKFITRILDGYFISDTDMVEETNRTIKMIIAEYPEYDYLFHLNRLEVFLNE